MFSYLAGKCKWVDLVKTFYYMFYYWMYGKFTPSAVGYNTG